eukprot:Opistho-2@9328
MASEEDWYGLPGLSPDCADKEIAKAYRTKARESHPDKVADKDASAKETAARKFHLIGRAYEVLSDPAKKEAYDKTLRSRAAVKKRDNALDDGRRKMKADLEEAEQRAAKRPKTYGHAHGHGHGTHNSADAERRLREENLRRLEQLREAESQQQQLRKATSASSTASVRTDAGGQVAGSASSLDDYERQVLENLRRAQERKKAAEEAKKEAVAESG